MKKIVVVLLFVMTVIGGNAFAAGEENVSTQVTEAFKKEFPNVEYAKWEKLPDYDLYVVRFIYDNRSLVAYYNEEGAMVATARIAGKDNLPNQVDRAIRKMYSDAEIVKVEELTMGGRLSYFFTVQADGSEKVLRIYSDGTVEKIRSRKNKISEKE